MTVRYYTTDDERLLVRRDEGAPERFSYETLDWVLDGLVAGIFIGEILVDEIDEEHADKIIDRIKSERP